MRSELQSVTNVPQAIQIGLEHYQAGRFANAEEVCRRVLGIDPNNPDALNMLGVIACRVGKSEIGAQLITSALGHRPDDAIFLSNLGNALRDLGRIEDAERSFRQALALRPGYAEAHSNLGNTLRDLGRLPEAEQCYRQALALKPDFAMAHNNLGDLLRDLGQLRDAEQSCRQALALKPDLAEAHNTLGTALHLLRRLAEAEASYRHALEIRPDYAEAHNNLGVILQDLGRLDGAVRSYRRAVDLKPDYIDAICNLGWALKEQGKSEAAAACFKLCLKLDPDDRLDARLLLAAIGREPMPSRASGAHLSALYSKRACAWGQANGNHSYRGAEMVAQALRRHSRLPARLNVLDAGCGTGLVGLLIRDLACRLDGIDMSSSMLEKARAKNIYDQIVQGDLESYMANNPNRYDAIACAATLIHFGDLSSVFRAAATCLRDEGLFVFTLFPNEGERDGKEVVVAPLNTLARGGCYAHGRGYISRLAEAAGFLVDTLDTEIHEYHDGTPIGGLIVVLRRRP
jgi:predicted TPR repeat methyltransferase